MATPSKATLAKLISELTGKSERYALDGYSDEQIAGMVLSVAAVLTPDQVFNSASVAQLAVDRPDLYNATEAVVYAAASTPALVFSGGPGVVKLEAWAHANGLHDGPEAILYAASMPTAREVFSGAPGLVKLIAWANSEAVLTVFAQEVVNAVASTDDPADVFAGVPGIAKLAAWAIANGYTKA